MNDLTNVTIRLRVIARVENNSDRANQLHVEMQVTGPDWEGPWSQSFSLGVPRDVWLLSQIGDVYIYDFAEGALNMEGRKEQKAILDDI